MIRKYWSRLLKWGWDYERNQIEISPIAKASRISVSDGPDIEGMRFTLMRATGGIILQTRIYDNKRDRHDGTTYIITDEEPLAERIGQIVSMEILKS
jgi:hypothetical protein